MTGRSLGLLAIAGLALGLAACAGAPVPQAVMVAAEDAVVRAEAADALELAPSELARAQVKLAGAQAAVREQAGERARRLIEQALVDAELAEARARTAAAQANARRLRQHIDGGWREFAARTGDG